jgi:hypothetical protein
MSMTDAVYCDLVDMAGFAISGLFRMDNPPLCGTFTVEHWCTPGPADYCRLIVPDHPSRGVMIDRDRCWGEDGKHYLTLRLVDI